MKEEHLRNGTIRGELPTTIPDSHILVYDEAIGEGFCISYFLVPKDLWEEFETLRTKVEEQAELVYELEEHYSPYTNVLTAVRYKEKFYTLN